MDVMTYVLWLKLIHASKGDPDNKPLPEPMLTQI